MRTRMDLQRMLEDIMGTRNVYFQPPGNVKMEYPCIVYDMDQIDMHRADNEPYMQNRRYSLTLIDRNPESPILDKLLALPYVAFNQHFTSDGLHHFILSLYF